MQKRNDTLRHGKRRGVVNRKNDERDWSDASSLADTTLFLYGQATYFVMTEAIWVARWAPFPPVTVYQTA